jgi:hypothetical protein
MPSPTGLAEAHVAGMGRTPSRPAVAEDVRHLDRPPNCRAETAGRVIWKISSILPISMAFSCTNFPSFVEPPQMRVARRE